MQNLDINIALLYKEIMMHFILKNSNKINQDKPKNKKTEAQATGIHVNSNHSYQGKLPGTK